MRLRFLLSLCALLAAVPALSQEIQPIVVGNRVTLHSETLDEERGILVRTPPGYERNGESYPVLYITDGDAHFLHTVGAVEFLARNGRMPEMIVIGIGNTDRTRDLTPTRGSREREDGTVAEFPTSGGADRFLEFIETELKPWVDENFRTQSFEILGGHSFGGLFAVHVMLNHPDTFDAYIAVSPSLWWDDQLPISQARERFKRNRSFDKFVFVTLGDEGAEMQDGFDKLQAIFKKSKAKGLTWGSEQWLDEDHGSVVLRSHYFAFRGIYDGWAVPLDQETGITAGGLAGIRQHYAGLSSRYGYSIPVPERTINLLGYQLLGRERFDEAIAVFEYNVEQYPDSANVYDSLGEVYEKQGELGAAHTNYRRASERGKQIGDPAESIYTRNMNRVAAALAASSTD